MILRNTTSERIAAQPKFITLAGIANGNSVVLPEVILGPNETTEVDLTPLSEATRNRTDLDLVSVEVGNSGAPGSLIGSLYGTNKKTGVNYETPLRDSGPVRTMTGSYPWKTSRDYTTIVYITNISDREAEFVAQINHGTERFVIDPRKLKPGETAVFDLAKIRDEQMKDNVGRRLPRTASLGQFKWAVRGTTDGKLLLIGRAEMVSLSDHITTSYSCNDPCPPYYVMTIDGFPNLAALNQETDDFVAWETAQYGSGYNMGPYTGYVSCSVDNAIATFDSSDWGHSTCMTGTSEGDANMLAFSRMEESYSWDGLNCYDNYNQYLVGEQGPVQVVCATPTNFHRTSGSDAGSGTLHVEYAWESTTGRLSDLSQCTVNEKVDYNSSDLPFASPPFPAGLNPANPTILPVPPIPGPNGLGQDNHSTPGTFVKPYVAKTITATQNYRYTCACASGGQPVNMFGPVSIVRSVSQNANGSWKFTITKDGQSATINPLP